MERLGGECAKCVVNARNFGRSSPLVIDGGMVHCHISAADAHALGMGFQCVIFLRIDGDTFGSGDFTFSGQCDAHIPGIFHVGKGERSLGQRNPSISNFCTALALVVCVDGNIPLAFNVTVRDIDIRCALVHDASVANANANASHFDCVHIDFGTVASLCLNGFDIDIIARNGSIIQCHIRVMVHMDDGIRNTGGHSATHSNFCIFGGNVTGLLCRHNDILTGC